MMQLTFITGNQAKYAEAKHILPDLLQKSIDLPEIQSLNQQEVIEAKLEHALSQGVENIIVEDTGLYLEGLNGLPGVFTKWFIASIGLGGIYRLAQSFSITDAKAVTIIGYADIQGEFHYFVGETKGKISAPQGDGMGWDALFTPDGYNQTYAQMGIEAKNQTSSRSRALTSLKAFLDSN